jgi:flavin reductase (DIM6/NTAB) family NADH-FMN oxidoreductase RutF
MNEASVQEALTLFDRAAWIVTSSSNDDIGGLVATFVSNASLVPTLPRLVIGIAHHHHTWGLIHESRSFAAHLVDEEHLALMWRFGLGSGRDVNKFADLRWRRGQTGSPVLEEALAWLDCAVEVEVDIGDRTIFVAAIVDGGVSGVGAALTANRMLELAGDEQLRQMREERQRDEELDASAILIWRARLR